MHFFIHELSTSTYDEEAGARILHVSYANSCTKIEVVAEKIVPSVALQLWRNPEDADT